MTPSFRIRPARRTTARVMLALLLLASAGQTALGASSWNPTVLVNTESFQTIDEGDSTTNIEIRFGQSLNERLFYDRSNGRFEFTKGLVINGDTKIRGNLSGSTLTIDGLRNCDSIDTDANGNLVCGTDSNAQFSGTGALQNAFDNRYINSSGDTMTGSLKVRATLSGSSLQIDNNAVIKGQLSVTGAIKTRGNLTINSEADTNDAVLTFGNQTASQTLQYSNANQRFEFSKDLKVTGGVRASGNLSGSTLNVDGVINLRGQSYTFPGQRGAAGTFLQEDGAGNLSWTSTSVGNSSGNILSLHPAYPNAVYTASGSGIGQLTYSGALGTDNFYRWTTSKATLQSYVIAVRVQVPKNFSHWETASGVLVRLRTGTTTAADNHVTFRMLDTAGATVAVGNNGALKSGTAGAWRTNTITGITGGTFTPLGYITLLIKVAATSTGYTDLGFIDLRWTTTTP